MFWSCNMSGLAHNDFYVLYDMARIGKGKYFCRKSNGFKFLLDIQTVVSKCQHLILSPESVAMELRTEIVPDFPIFYTEF